MKIFPPHKFVKSTNIYFKNLYSLMTWFYVANILKSGEETEKSLTNISLCKFPDKVYLKFKTKDCLMDRYSF